MTLADVNADGKPDILAATYRSGIRIFLNQGNGSFYQDRRPVDSWQFLESAPACGPRAAKAYWPVRWTTWD